MPGGEEGSIEVALEDASGEGPADGDPRQARRRRRGLVAVGLVVVAAVGVTSAVMTAQDGRRERDRREALADVPGLLPHLDGPPEELWHVADGLPFAVGREVVVLESADAGDLRALDLRGGHEVWSRPVAADESCVALSDDSSPLRFGPGATVADYVACYPRFATVEGYRVVVGDPATVEVLDIRSGAIVAEVPTPADVLGVEQTGGDVVVASLDGDGAVVVSRWETGPGQLDGPVWSTRLPEPLEAIEESGWVFHAEAEVVRAGTVGSVPLDLTTGVPLPDTARGGVLFTVEAPLPGGERVEWDYDEVARTVGRSRVVGADGVVVRELDGRPWGPRVADASSPEVLLLRRPTSAMLTGEESGDLVAVDVTTGEDLWSGGRMAGMEALVRLDDVVVAAGAGTVVALDVRDGDVLWEDRRSGASPRLGGLTDGEVVLVAETAGVGPALVARDMRTGVERWHLAFAEILPADAPTILVPTDVGLLVLVWDGGATMLGAR